MNSRLPLTVIPHAREGFRELGLQEGETGYAILRNPKIYVAECI
jgi:hypothetical protein